MARSNQKLDKLDFVLKDMPPDFQSGIIRALKLPPRDEKIVLNIYLKTHKKFVLAKEIGVDERWFYAVQNKAIKTAEHRLKLLILTTLKEQI